MTIRLNRIKDAERIDINHQLSIISKASNFLSEVFNMSMTLTQITLCK